ncbi:MAG: ferritin family protein [Candidatus Thermoplasmatota archaeon]|nr:ferritin family protein [Candidatus Thermoplasmatota archaeon]
MNEDKLDEFSLKELIGYSIEAEKSAQKFYEDFSKAAIGVLVKERFRGLVRDEKVHKDRLLDLHEELFGDKDYVVPDSDDLPPHETSYDFTGARNVLDSLEKAMENESNAKTLYEYMGERFEEYSSFFKYLALMEKGHYESLVEEKKLMEGEYEEGKKGDQEGSQDFWERMFDFSTQTDGFELDKGR